MSNQISQDVFYLVKKQILDKLDVILQKVNLQVIQHLRPNVLSHSGTISSQENSLQSFKFIQLQSFQKQINILFEYLDRLYSSLNSSVSFSSVDIKNSHLGNEIKNNQNNVISNSIGSMSILEKQKYQILQMEYQNVILQNVKIKDQKKKINYQNQQLKKIINKISPQTHINDNDNIYSRQSSFIKNQKSINSNQSKSASSSHYQPNQSSQILMGNSTSNQQSISIETVRKILRFYNHSIKQVGLQYRNFVNEIKRFLKQQRFKILQNRVECIAKLKQFQENNKSYQEKNNKNKNINIRKTNLQVQQGQQAINCGQNCWRMLYSQKSKSIEHQSHQQDKISYNKYAYEEDILMKIQQILQIC